MCVCLHNLSLSFSKRDSLSYTDICSKEKIFIHFVFGLYIAKSHQITPHHAQSRHTFSLRREMGELVDERVEHAEDVLVARSMNSLVALALLRNAVVERKTPLADDLLRGFDWAATVKKARDGCLHGLIQSHELLQPLLDAG